MGKMAQQFKDVQGERVSITQDDLDLFSILENLVRGVTLGKANPQILYTSIQGQGERFFFELNNTIPEVFQTMTTSECETTREVILKGIKHVFDVLKSKMTEEHIKEVIWVSYIDDCLSVTLASQHPVVESIMKIIIDFYRQRNFMFAARYMMSLFIGNCGPLPDF